MKRAALLVFLLSACGSESGEGGNIFAAEGAERVECALNPAASFEPVCALERSMGPRGLILTIRGPSGGFRRLLVTKDGRGVVAADGAEAAEVIPLGPDRIEVRVAGERYRLPATVRR
jgi:hypothetical protein